MRRIMLLDDTAVLRHVDVQEILGDYGLTGLELAFTDLTEPLGS